MVCIFCQFHALHPRLSLSSSVSHAHTPPLHVERLLLQPSPPLRLMIPRKVMKMMMHSNGGRE